MKRMLGKAIHRTAAERAAIKGAAALLLGAALQLGATGMLAQSVPVVTGDARVDKLAADCCG